MRSGKTVVAVAGLAGLALLVLVGVRSCSQGPTYESKGGVTLTVTSPERNQEISSPLRIRGSVPGSWTFEADFGVELLDADRKPVAIGFASVKGDWMTDRVLPFTSTLAFTPPESETGVLILRKANPSDLEGTADSLEIPVRFASG